MHGKQRFDHLELDHHAFSDQKIDPVTIIDHQIRVANRDQYLSAHCQGVLL